MQIDPRRGTTNSRIDLPALTVINVDSADFYDAAFAGGSIVSAAAYGDTLLCAQSLATHLGALTLAAFLFEIFDPNTTLFHFGNAGPLLSKIWVRL